MSLLNFNSSQRLFGSFALASLPLATVTGLEEMQIQHQALSLHSANAQ